MACLIFTIGGDFPSMGPPSVAELADLARARLNSSVETVSKVPS